MATAGCWSATCRSACSGGSRSPGPWPTGPSCSSWTSPRRAWTRWPGPGCGRRSPAPRCGHRVLVSTHYMDEAGECGRLVIMADGRVVAAGTAAQITGDARVSVVETGDVGRGVRRPGRGGPRGGAGGPGAARARRQPRQCPPGPGSGDRAGHRGPGHTGRTVFRAHRAGPRPRPQPGPAGGPRRTRPRAPGTLRPPRRLRPHGAHQHGAHQPERTSTERPAAGGRPPHVTPASDRSLRRTGARAPPARAAPGRRYWTPPGDCSPRAATTALRSAASPPTPGSTRPSSTTSTAQGAPVRRGHAAACRAG